MHFDTDFVCGSRNPAIAVRWKKDLTLKITNSYIIVEGRRVGELPVTLRIPAFTVLLYG